MMINPENQVENILLDLDKECSNHLTKWGDQRHPDGTGTLRYVTEQAEARVRYEMMSEATEGDPSWDLILLEEVYEALSEKDHAELRKELVQVAAVCVSWIHDIDRR
jgi:hypothetical protein